MVHRRFICYERRIPSIAVFLKSDVRLRSFDIALAATREVLGDERPNPFLGVSVASDPTVAGDKRMDPLLALMQDLRRQLVVTTEVTDTLRICHLARFLGVNSVVLFFFNILRLWLVVRD